MSDAGSTSPTGSITGPGANIVPGTTILQSDGLAVVAPEAVTFEQTVQCRAIDARQARGARHVAGRPRHEPGDVLLLEAREHLILCHVIGLVHRDAERGRLVGND